MEQIYFKNYCERGQAYADCWREHSGIDDLLYTIKKLKLKKHIHTILVLGSADSSILDALEAESFVADGIELIPEIVPRKDTRVRVGNFLKIVPQMFKEGYVFDLIFSNSLVYLDWHRIVPFLGFCSHMSPYFHFTSSTTEHAAKDTYRKTLQPQEQWDRKFMEAGWSGMSLPYLYQSRIYQHLD
jgi:hypothetical protein